MARRILVNLDPLRQSRDFRILFAGQLVAEFGTQFTLVAVAFQVFEITHSSFQVGAVSLTQLVPLIFGALLGGSLGDTFDRRRILVAATAALGVTAGVLGLNSVSGHPLLVVIYLVSAANAAFGGVISTLGNAAVANLVPTRQLVSAYASMQVVDQVGLVVAPAISGLLIGALHLKWLYVLVAGINLLAALTLLAMSAIPPDKGAKRPSFGAIAEGVRYLRGRQWIQGAYLLDLNAMVFGMPRALFPALALTSFHGGATVLGWLYAAPGVGAFLGALTTGWLEQVRRQGLAVIVAVSLWGAGVVAFGLVHVLWACLVLLAVAGWADVISAVLRSTIQQSSVPDSYRARISSLHIAVVTGGPRLGDLEAGAVASLSSVEISIVSGGLACIIGTAVLSLLLPGFRRYRRPEAREHGRAGEAGPLGGVPTASVDS
jgi:MFS family permease